MKDWELLWGRSGTAFFVPLVVGGCYLSHSRRGSATRRMTLN